MKTLDVESVKTLIQSRLTRLRNCYRVHKLMELSQSMLPLAKDTYYYKDFSFGVRSKALQIRNADHCF